MALIAKTERLCGFVHVQSPAVSKGMKRLVNPSDNTLGLSVEDSSNPVKVHQALMKRFGGNMSVQAKRTEKGRIFQTEGESFSSWEC